MTDETLVPPDPDEEADDDVLEPDGDNEPVEGDTSEEDSTPEPDVKSGEIPADAI